MHYVFMLTERRAGRNFLHLKRLDASPVKVRKRTYQTLKNTATSHESNSLGQKNQTPNERKNVGTVLRNNVVCSFEMFIEMFIT